MLFVGTSIIHHSTEGVFLLCNILDLFIYRYIQKLLLFLKKMTETCTWGWSLRQWFDIILSNKNQEDPI